MAAKYTAVSTDDLSSAEAGGAMPSSNDFTNGFGDDLRLDDRGGIDKEETLLRGVYLLVTLRIAASAVVLYLVAPLQPSHWYIPAAVLAYAAAVYVLYKRRDDALVKVIPLYAVYTVCESCVVAIVVCSTAAPFIHVVESSLVVMTGAFLGLVVSTYKSFMDGFIWRVICTSSGAAVAFVVATFTAPLGGAVALLVVLLVALISVAVVLTDAPMLMQHLEANEVVLGSLILGCTTMCLGMTGRR